MGLLEEFVEPSPHAWAGRHPLCPVPVHPPAAPASAPGWEGTGNTVAAGGTGPSAERPHEVGGEWDRRQHYGAFAYRRWLGNHESSADRQRRYEAFAYRGARYEPSDRNAWGFCDMLGNVWEWCEDTFGESPPEETEDPVHRSGTERAYRGGSWRTDFGSSGSGMGMGMGMGFGMGGGLSSGGGGMSMGMGGDLGGEPGGESKASTLTRGHALPDHRSDDLGFRVCRSLDLGSEAGEGPAPAVEEPRKE